MPALVQAVAGGVVGATTLTFTIGATGGSPQGSGANCLFLAVFQLNTTATSVAPTAVTLGATNFTLQGTAFQPENAGILSLYAIPSVPSGRTSVTVTQAATTDSGIQAYALEFSGINAATPLDQQSAGTATETPAWSSAATSTTTQAIEVAIGIFGGWDNAAFSPVGPGSPWVNQTIESETLAGGGGNITQFFTGYNILSTAQAVTFAGTGGNTGFWNTAKVWTFLAQAPIPAVPTNVTAWMPNRVAVVAGRSGCQSIPS